MELLNLTDQKSVLCVLLCTRLPWC